MAANTMKIGVELTNFKEFAGLLRELPAAVESRVMGDAMKVAAQPILRIARSLAAVRTGALKRSLIVVIKRYPKTGKILAIIGPDRNYYSGGRKVRNGASRRGADRPANYAHLVEFGHYSGVRSGAFGGFAKGTRRRKGTAVETVFIRAQPFLRPAAATGGPMAVRELARGFRVGQERELRRLASKIKRANAA